MVCWFAGYISHLYFETSNVLHILCDLKKPKLKLSMLKMLQS